MARRSGFRWIEDGVEHSYSFRVPLMQVAPRRRRREWRFNSNRGDVFTERSAGAQTDVEGVVRFGKNPQRLLHLLSTQLGRAITYYEVRGGVTVEYPAVLVSVSPGDASQLVGIDQDPQRFSHGEYSAHVRLRFADPAHAAEVISPYVETP